MRKSFKTITAAALSAAMILAPSITSFAEESETAAATGQILAHKCQTIVVPTALKLAVNPNQTAVNTKYAPLADDATFSAGTKYYEIEGEEYKLAEVDSTSFDPDGLYTAVTSTGQKV